MRLASTILLAITLSASAAPLDWPAVTKESRPWAYNWWLGSAVDKENLARELRRYRDGGLGGIHIIPIYGAKGAESRYVKYLSPEWLDIFRFTVQEADHLGLGVDMTTGTGWCFGGPTVTPAEACIGVTPKVIEVRAGASVAKKDLANLNIVVLVAESPDGKVNDLLDKLTPDRGLDWKAPAAGWKVHALAAKPTSRVKRSSPGGEGYMLNPFYAPAVRSYLARFTDAFPLTAAVKPRAMYHDSFEYHCGWSPDLPQQFQKRRGYNLLERIPALFGSGRDDTTARLKADVRETISDMMIEDVFPLWTDWCRQRKILTRNQAHGSPGNLLDLYALADIPETEMFGRGTRDPLVSRFDERFGEGDREPLVSKLASSAAHVAGRRLVASETGTWMAEHFCETLEEMKCFVDLLFASGINHVVYHGCCYSPDDAAWPGWLFYASTEMNPRNAIWRDAPTLNAYIARCQSVLQSGQSDSDLLVYWPIHDLWHSPKGLVNNLTVHSRDWLLKQPVGETARSLWKAGYGFDYVSDRLLNSASATEQGVNTPGGAYRAIVVPPTTHMPVATMRKLLVLGEAGATVIFQDKLPGDVPGLADLEKRQGELKAMLATIAPVATSSADVRQAKLGKGRILIGNLASSVALAGIDREPIADHPGTLFIRRRHETGQHYFIANQGMTPIDGYIALATPASSVAILDPLTGQAGLARVKQVNNRPQVYLQLPPGHSIILRTFAADTPAQPWAYHKPAADAVEIKGPWKVRFLEGGPALPKPYEIATLESWTKSPDPEAERFAGAALYTTTFDAPNPVGKTFLLDLGKVCHSARVRVNGRDLGTLIMNPYRVSLDNLKPTGNTLEVEVTNLSANRLRDLDRRKVQWRIFNDINIVNINYRPFDASKWPVFDSGLLGPVRLVRDEH